jgi:predicted RNA-binding protein with PIN domain
VFDAGEAPPGLPNHLNHRGLKVEFAPRDEDADTLIEQMIEDCRAPRDLVVVSSDHRLHRAARRRRAKAIDSDVWYAEKLRAVQSRNTPSDPASLKPPAPATEAEVQFWLRQFEDSGDPDDLG